MDPHIYLFDRVFFLNWKPDTFYHRCEWISESGGMYIEKGKCVSCGYKVPVSRKKLEVMRGLKELTE